jgi:hypothetical protein
MRWPLAQFVAEPSDAHNARAARSPRDPGGGTGQRDASSRAPFLQRNVRSSMAAGHLPGLVDIGHEQADWYVWPLSAVGCRLSAVGCRLSAVGCRLSAELGLHHDTEMLFGGVSANIFAKRPTQLRMLESTERAPSVRTLDDQMAHAYTFAGHRSMVYDANRSSMIIHYTSH